MLLLGGAGCVKDDYGLSSGVKEGHPVTVKMTLGMGKTTDIVVTRADNSNSTLSTLTLFVYDAAGTVCQQVLTLEGGSLVLLGADVTGPNGERLYQVTFQTTSGEKKLLGVANYTVGEEGFWSGFTSLRNAAEAGTLTFDALRSGMVSLRDALVGSDGLILPSITANTQMLISGWNEGAVFSTDGTVADFGTYGDAQRSVLLKMDRAMARITFNIAAAPAGAQGTFTPSTFRVYNIPKSTLLVKSTTAGADPYTPDLLAEEDFLTSAMSNVGALSGGSYSFSFYMPENVQPTRTENAEGGAMTYADRDKWTGPAGSLPEAKTWSNAPQTGTFVVINGTYTESNGQYTGNVSYTVHLGDFSATGSQGNFSVERNCSYTYNMSVLGVDRIVVEAKKETGEEYQQAAEGEIYDAGNCIYNYQLDAHYEQVYLQYDLTSLAQSLPAGLTGEDLDNAISSKLILVIQSEAMDHSSDGVSNKRGSLQPYKIYADAVRNAADPVQAAAAAKSAILDDDSSNAGSLTPKKGFDYKWIEFWPQTGTTLASYPGTPTWSQAYIADKAPTGDNATKAGYLMDVYDVIVAMGKVVKKIYLNGQGEQNTISTADRAEDGITVTLESGGSYLARFTAFVNEYYYYAHPLTGAPVTTWSVLVNKMPREMVIAMSTDVSVDGNSSFSQIHSYISQLSMQTFYSSRTEQINAFGLETYNETPLTMNFSSSVGDGSLDDLDGRQNQIRLISGDGDATALPQNIAWQNYIDVSNNGWTQTIPTDRTQRKLYDAYAPQSNAAYACLSRNRDLNGNGMIDDNELRWYLPSLNEYIRIGIGNNVLSNASRLYMGDKMAMVGNLYPGSYIQDGALYYTSSASGKRVFWAVEHGAYGNDGTYKRLPIRCVRVLPAITESQDATIVAVKPVSTFEKLTDGSNIILKFKGRLVDELYRERTDDVLLEHSEDETPNSFSEGIIVAQAYMTNYFPLTQIVNEGGNQSNPCATYHETGDGGATWRVPNLVELQALNAANMLYAEEGVYNFNNYTVCCTQFSNSNVRYGFMYNGPIACMQYNERTQSSKVRCVRDVPAGYDFSRLSPAN